MAKKIKLWPEDVLLFREMRKCYQSRNEQEFFETMRYKQEHELSFPTETILLPESTPCNIGVQKSASSDFYVFFGERRARALSLYEALNISLPRIGYKDNITLFQWLRLIDYKGVQYGDAANNMPAIKFRDAYLGGMPGFGSRAYKNRETAKHQHKLWKEDELLFAKMEGNYASPNEQKFFEALRYKQECILTISNDLILWEGNNDDGIYIVRCNYEEYIVGCESSPSEEHVMCLAKALSLNLKRLGYIESDLTLLQWLRLRDYAGVEYDHNYDDL